MQTISIPKIIWIDEKKERLLGSIIYGGNKKAMFCSDFHEHPLNWLDPTCIWAAVIFKHTTWVYVCNPSENVQYGCNAHTMRNSSN